MSFFLALDAGGTHTRCALADETRVLARASCGSVKLMRVDAVTATQRIQGLVDDVTAQAGIDAKMIAMTCFGLAGLSIDSVREWAVQTLSGCVRKFNLCGDEEIALDAAFAGGPGVVVIAGTGSNVVGRCGDGAMLSAGGWGPMLGDEGSGNWIGVEAIKAALRAQDRGAETRLLREIEAHWGLASAGQLLGHANARPRPDFAELAEVVARCADGGDALAAAVLERAGQELADQVSLVASKMHQHGCAGDAQRIAFTGSVLEKIPLVRASLHAALRGSLPASRLDEAAVDPLDGALWRARKG
jgi:N-acetylglucosamine kinase-like BadF-type ATPase